MMVICGLKCDFMQTKIQIADYDMYFLEDRPELADLPERPLHLLLSIFMSKDLWKVRTVLFRLVLLLTNAKDFQQSHKFFYLFEKRSLILSHDSQKRALLFCKDSSYRILAKIDQ